MERGMIRLKVKKSNFINQAPMRDRMNAVRRALGMKEVHKYRFKYNVVVSFTEQGLAESVYEALQIAHPCRLKVNGKWWGINWMKLNKDATITLDIFNRKPLARVDEIAYIYPEL